MSGRGLPYRLRPNKYVDREMFAEFVSVLVSGARRETYVYVSMGGNHLSDHVAIYRRSGIKNLYAFDIEQEVVARQKFNAPFDGVCCEAHPSGELPARLEEILNDFSAQNVIVWLDYTEAKRFEQLQEVQALSSKLVNGDVIRVTINADFANLDNLEFQLSAREKELPKLEKQAALLKKDLGIYSLPEVQQIDFDEMPIALTKSVRRAVVLGCQSAHTNTSPIPVMLTQYQDTSRMVTVTVLMSDTQDPPFALDAWGYAPTDWGDIEKIFAPDLSPRERYALDKLMHKQPEEINESLGFPIRRDAIAAYMKFHRFYPSFQSVND